MPSFVKDALVSAAVYAAAATVFGPASLTFVAAFQMAFTASVVLGGIAYATQKRPSSSGSVVAASGRLVSIRQPISPWQIIVGRCRAGGTYSFFHTEGENMHFIITLAGHICAGIDEIYFDDELVPLDGSGNAVGKYAGFVRIKKSLGDEGAAQPFPDLVTESGGKWDTARHRQQGRTKIYVRLTKNQDLFPTGVPNITAVLRGAADIYDTRTAGTGYSNNAELVTRWYIANTAFGIGATISEFDADTVDAHANICDERMPYAADSATFTADASTDVLTIQSGKALPQPGEGVRVSSAGTLPAGLSAGVTYYVIADAPGIKIATSLANAAAGTAIDITDAGIGTHTLTYYDEPRYTINGAFLTSEKPQSIIEQMLLAMAGRSVYVGGVWHIYSGAYEAPTLTLTEDDLAGKIRTQSLLSRRDNCNRVKGQYVSPENGWQPTDAPALISDTYTAEDEGDPAWRDMDLSKFVTSVTQSQRLFKIELLRTRQGLTHTAPFKLTAYRAMTGRTVSITYAKYGWTAKPFEITASRFIVGDDLSLNVELALRESAAAVYDWATSEEQLVDLAPNTTLPDPFTIEAPTSVSFVENSYIAPDGSEVNGVSLTWVSSVTPWVTQYEVQGKESTESAWQSFPILDGTRFDFAPVIPGKTYQARVRAVSSLGVRSDWAPPTTPAEVTILGYATALPAFTSAQAFFSPDDLGDVHRFKIRLTITDDPALYPSQLAMFIAADRGTARAVSVVTDEGTRVKISNIGVTWSSSYDTVKAGSDTGKLVLRSGEDPDLPTNINLAGRYWARFGSSEWRKITSYDETTLYFATPFDLAPSEGQTVDLVEITWADERPDTWRLVRLKTADGTQSEVARWAGDIDQIGSDFYVNLSDRGLEGTTQIDATGGDMAYFPAPGAGSRMIPLPLLSLTSSGGVLTGECEVSFELPATWWISATALAYRTSSNGNVRSPLTFLTYGGPYDASA